MLLKYAIAGPENLVSYFQQTNPVLIYISCSQIMLILSSIFGMEICVSKIM